MEKKTRYVEEWFRRLLDATPDPLVVTNQQANIVLVNSEAEKLFGYRRDEMIGRNVEFLVPERLKDSLSRALSVVGVERSIIVLRKTGEEISVEVRVSPLETPEGTLSITAFRDVTERLRVEEERAKLAQAQEAIRMREEFLSIASHELKTPLTVLGMQAESIVLAAEQGAGSGVPERIVHKAKIINKAAKRLELLVNQLLDLSRITTGRLELYPEQVDLAALAKTIAQQFDAAASRAGGSITVTAAEPVWGCWDELRTEQILSNLISNAIKYGNGKPIEVSVTRGEESATLIVRDRGIGIDPQHQQRIFDRFERLVSERNYGGFGVGLWIVRQIIESQGGTIAVWSQPGEGSIFTVELPRRLDCAIRPQPRGFNLQA